MGLRWWRVETLTPDDLRAMWEPVAQGTVVRWSDVNPDWPEEELHLFGPGVDSGIFDYFTQAIVGEEEASRGDFTSSEDDNVLVQGVANDELALGFFGYAYYEANQHRLKLAAIDDGDESNGAGAIQPSPDTVREGIYQPLSWPVYLYVNPAALERPSVTGFANFFLTDGVELTRVFERFCRVDLARGRDPGGPGLGTRLSSISSGLHGGTRFVIELPYVDSGGAVESER